MLHYQILVTVTGGKKFIKKMFRIFEYIIKIPEQFGGNPIIQTYITKIERRNKFKIKNKYYL